MYGLVRVVIGCICLGVALLITKNKEHKRKFLVGSIALALLLMEILAFIPFENLFISFNTPEEAFYYYNGKKAKVSLVVEGNDSDLVIGDDNGSTVYLIVPKTDDGWTVGTGIHTKRTVQKLHNEIIIYVYQYKDTGNYFITVLAANGEYIQIADSLDSDFTSLEKGNTVGENAFVIYYASISQYSQDYWLSVNGEKIILPNT